MMRRGKEGGEGKRKGGVLKGERKDANEFFFFFFNLL